jgi:hypothetical protein
MSWCIWISSDIPDKRNKTSFANWCTYLNEYNEIAVYTSASIFKAKLLPLLQQKEDQDLPCCHFVIFVPT